jgi:predicted  nucleic acid-binding Zn-ribbon protein
MYAVVGCTDCGTLWLLSDPDASETARCPRCGRRHQTRKLRRFATTEDRDEARQVRSALLARKRDESEALGDLETVVEMEQLIEDAGVDDREYLEGSGLDAEAVSDAGDVSSNRGTSRSRPEVVRAALREIDSPTEEDVVAYAEERGVPGDSARDLLRKLTRRGEVSESRGSYRLL